MKRVTIHTDGGCLGNPGPGGWAVVLECDGHKKELSGGEPATTNNRMELLGAIRALEALKKPCAVDFYTDSTYVRNGITKWVHSWKVRGWKTAAKEPVKNEDLWRALDAATAGHQITWHWLKGHAGHEHNERCDQLAGAEMTKLKTQFTPAQLKASVEAFQQNRQPAARESGLFS